MPRYDIWTYFLFDLVNPPLVENFAEEFGVPASSPSAAGAGQAGRTVSVQATSVDAYRDLADTLPAREQAVLIGLRRHWASYRQAPTSYELFESMRADGCAFDLNSVRPRLTALWKKGRVIQQARRRCSVTGKTAYTWAINEES